MTVEPKRLLSIAGRPPGTSPPSSKKVGREAIDEQWEATAMQALATIVQARESSGAPIPTQQLLTLLRKTLPRVMHPLQKRAWLQTRGFLVAVGDGTWDLPER